MARTDTSPPPAVYACWSDGTKALTTMTTTLSKMTSTTSLLGNEGLCYKLEIANTVPATRTDYTWTNTGTSVTAATGYAAAATPNLITIQCDGVTYMVDTTSAICQGQTLTPVCSTAGACSF